ncbi:MAG: ABC transporter permease subunit [Gracilibacteraceae bacterium]|jgi:ABC-2 type transport system permease protein|nr:ABC transporter permease subunit [Gracilibacteraceae bacterium]
MTSFLASYRGEWDKLINRKKYLVFIGIGVGLCLLWAGFGYLFADFVKLRGGVNIILTPTPMGVLPFFLQIMVPFLMFMGVTDLLTVEDADKTMKAVLCRPVERWKLYTAKILAVLTYAALYLACVFVVSTGLNQLFGRPLGAADFFIALASYALTLAPLAVLATFAALVALWGRSGTLTMFVLLCSYMLLSVLPVFFPVLSEILFTSYLSWYKLWIGALPGAAKLVQVVIIVLGYGTVFYMAGSLLFDRKEY